MSKPRKPQKPNTMTASKTGAMRDNKGKLPFSLVPYEVVEAIAAVLYYSSTEGGGKYPKNNWKKGAEHSIPMDSLLRHSLKRCRGEMIDDGPKGSGLPHSWHMLVNAAFLVYYEQHSPELNDLVGRPKTEEKNEAKRRKQ